MSRRTTWRCSTWTGSSTSAATPCPGAAEHLARRARGRACGWRSSPTTPSRPPEAVAEHLRELGVEAHGGRRRDLGPGGGAGAGRPVRRRRPGGAASARTASSEALRAAGLEPVAVADERRGGDRRPATARTCVWRDDHAGGGADPRRAAVGGQQHRPAPSRRRSGWRPGTACMVDDAAATSPACEPVVAGKPERPLLDETVRRVGGERPLMVGDRLDTDIEGAHDAGRRLAAGADRRDRARRAGGGAGRGCGRRTSPPTWRGLLRAARRRPSATATPGRSAAGARTVDATAARGRPATATPDDWWRVGARRGLGSTSTTAGEPVDAGRDADADARRGR